MARRPDDAGNQIHADVDTRAASSSASLLRWVRHGDRERAPRSGAGGAPTHRSGRRPGRPADVRSLLGVPERRTGRARRPHRRAGADTSLDQRCRRATSPPRCSSRPTTSRTHSATIVFAARCGVLTDRRVVRSSGSIADPLHRSHEDSVRTSSSSAGSTCNDRHRHACPPARRATHQERWSRASTNVRTHRRRASGGGKSQHLAAGDHPWSRRLAQRRVRPRRRVLSAGFERSAVRWSAA